VESLGALPAIAADGGTVIALGDLVSGQEAIEVPLRLSFRWARRREHTAVVALGTGRAFGSACLRASVVGARGRCRQRRAAARASGGPGGRERVRRAGAAGGRAPLTDGRLSRRASGAREDRGAQSGATRATTSSCADRRGLLAGPPPSSGSCPSGVARWHTRRAPTPCSHGPQQRAAMRAKR